MTLQLNTILGIDNEDRNLIYTRKKHLHLCKCFLCLSAASYQLRRCSLYFVRRFSPSKYVRNSALHATHSLCASLSLLQIGSPAIPVPEGLGPFTIDIKKDTQRSVLFLYLSAASYPPGPPPAKYFRRL